MSLRPEIENFLATEVTINIGTWSGVHTYVGWRKERGLGSYATNKAWSLSRSESGLRLSKPPGTWEENLGRQRQQLLFRELSKQRKLYQRKVGAWRLPWILVSRCG